MTTFLGRHSEADDHVAGLYAQGHDVRVVDGGTDKARVLEQFAIGLGLPTWFGHNWDALVDCLRDLTSSDGRPVEIVWDHVERLREQDPATYRTTLEILQQVESERPDLHVTVITR